MDPGRPRRQECGETAVDSEGAVKASWRQTELGEICDITIGRTPPRNEPTFWDVNRENSNVWLSIADLANAQAGIISDSKEYISEAGASRSKIVKAGTLLLSFKLTLGRLAIAGKDLYTNEAIAALTIRDPSQLNQKFLSYSLGFFDWNRATDGDVKLKGRTFNKAKLSKLIVGFPTLMEQERTVAILDEAFDGIAAARANAERSIQKATDLFTDFVRTIVTKRSHGWAEMPLALVSSEFGRGKSRHRPRNAPKLYGGPYPFIQTGDVSNADHWLTSYTQTLSEIGLAQSRLWPKGTVCIAIVGATVGETAILDFEACFPDSVIGIVVNPKVADNEYVEYLLQGFKAVLKEKGKGTARDNINMGTFENQKFPFPPLNQQKQIVATIFALREKTRLLCSIYKQKLEALEALKQSLLHQAFTGKL